MTSKEKPVRIRTLVGFGMIGQVSYLLSQLLTLIALTRLASVEEVGAFGLASAIVIPVFFFFGLRMQVNYASGEASGFSFGDHRTLLAGSVLIGLAVVIGPALIWFDGTAMALLILIAVAKAAECFSQLSYGVFQRLDRMHLVAASLIVRGLGSSLVVIAILWLTGNVVAAFAAQAAMWIVLATAIDLRRARAMALAAGDNSTAAGARMMSLARSSAYLAAGGLLSAVQGNIPRYVIAGVLSVASLGLFTVVGYAMQAIASVLGTVTETLVARLALYLSRGQGQAMRAVMTKLLAGVLCLGIVGVALSLWVGDAVISAVFGPDYANLGTLLAICLVAVSLQGVVLTLQTFLLAARRFGLIVVIRLFTVTAMLIACSVGAMWAGLNGVAWGMCAAFCIHIAALSVPVRRILGTADRHAAAAI